MSKSTNTVVYFDWKTVIYIYICFRHNLISTCTGECDWLFHWQYKLCATFSANVNINYRLPIKVYYRICTLRHIRIEINHESQNVFWVLTWIKAKEGGHVRIRFSLCWPFRHDLDLYSLYWRLYNNYEMNSDKTSLFLLNFPEFQMDFKLSKLSWIFLLYFKELFLFEDRVKLYLCDLMLTYLY
jgi:hypothetical protein